MTSLDIEAIRRRRDVFTVARARVLRAFEPGGEVDRAERAAADAGQYDTAVESALDVPDLLAEIERLRAELAEEKQSHEQTQENFSDWIEAHPEEPGDSFYIGTPTHDTGWTWKCLQCDKAYGSALRERDVMAAAVAHEHAAHSPSLADLRGGA